RASVRGQVIFDVVGCGLESCVARSRGGLGASVEEPGLKSATLSDGHVVCDGFHADTPRLRERAIDVLDRGEVLAGGRIGYGADLWPNRAQDGSERRARQPWIISRWPWIASWPLIVWRRRDRDRGECPADAEPVLVFVVDLQERQPSRSETSPC